jgi:hypothetical protein
MINSMKVIAPAFAALIGLAAITITLAFSGEKVAADTPAIEDVDARSCRAGVSAHGVDQAEWIDRVGAGWYVFFGGYTDVAGSDKQIAPVISVKQDKNGAQYLDSYTINPSLEALAPIITTYPGTLWIVGNEVDRGPNPDGGPGQGDTFPDVYARAYNEVYHFIKQLDPTALVANSGLVQVTPGRLQYLDLMWRSYRQQFNEPMPVDVWNMHLYVLPEAELDGTPNGIANVALGTDPALAKRGPGANPSQCVLDEIYCFAEHDEVTIFEQQMRAMRRWMYDHGQRHKPLILTEFSILFPCDDPLGENCEYLRDEFGNDFDKWRVQNYLVDTVAKLENTTDPVIGNPLDGGRLVQQWAWFSISTTSMVGDVSDLVRQDGDSGPLTSLTELGQQYLAEATALPSYTNLALAPVGAVAVESAVISGTADAPLRAEVVNNGSLSVGSAFSVTLYSDSALTAVIDQVNVPAPDVSNALLRGCAMVTVPVSVTWTGLTAGLHPFWVKVDSQDDVVEAGPAGELDNVGKSFVLVDSDRIWMPVFFR